MGSNSPLRSPQPLRSHGPLRSPRVIKTEDRLCSFVQRILPPGLQFEMTNAFHDDVVIVAFRGSTWLSQQSGQTYHERPGNVVLRNAGQVFSTRTLSCDEKTGSHCHEIHIPGGNLAELFLEHGIEELSFDFSNPVLEDSVLHRRVIHTQSVFESRECTLMRTTCLALLLRDIAETTHGASVNDNRPRQASRHRDVIAYMRDHYDTEIKLQTLAGIARVNPFVLLRQFGNDYGVTPHQYLRSFRVNKAMQFIRQGARLSDVAQLCGFCDQSHLNRQFKKTVGVSPGKYVARILSPGQDG